MAKASDNVFPKLIVSEGSTPTTPSSGQQKLFIDSADHKVKRVDSSGVVTTVEGGSGGTGSTIKDRLWTAATGVTVIDEFNDGALDPAWARVDVSGGTGRATWTEGADVLSVATAGGDATGELHAMMRPLTGAGGSMVAGDAFLAGMRMLGPAGTAYTMGALLLSTSGTYGSGTQVMAFSWASTSAGVQNNDLRTWTNYSTDPATQVANMLTTFSTVLHVRLVYLGTNVWRRDLSPDGVSWLTGTATITSAITPTHVGFATTTYGTSTKGIASFEYLRRTSGIS